MTEQKQYWAHSMYDGVHDGIGQENNTLSKGYRERMSSAREGARHSTLAAAGRRADTKAGYRFDTKGRVAATPARTKAANKALDGHNQEDTMKKSITCPHCEGDISKGYAIKALAILAKSEGIDIGEELEALAGLEESDAEKAVDTGNKRASHRGKAPGAMHSSSRGVQGAGGPVSRKQANKGNPTVRKSLSLPVTIGQPQLVDYTSGSDGRVSKGIEAGNLHNSVARNMRAEQELATGESTPE